MRPHNPGTSGSDEIVATVVALVVEDEEAWRMTAILWTRRGNLRDQRLEQLGLAGAEVAHNAHV